MRDMLFVRSNGKQIPRAEEHSLQNAFSHERRGG